MMDISANSAGTQEILPWRDLYRAEMNCQIVHDSLHAREGWTESYFLRVGGQTAGYGSAVFGGPWKGKPAIFEFYVLPDFRCRAFDLYAALAAASKAEMIETQTHDELLSVMLHTFAQDIVSEKIIFRDLLTTTHPQPGVLFRRLTSGDADQVAAQQLDAGASWGLELDGKIVATGGILFHYNRPYGDICMEVAEPFRRRGLGACLVQELKRTCYEQGSVPAARCNTANIASRKTLQKAGFVPCGHILAGSIRPAGIT